MNYFELHLGDYEAATAHLTALEDGLYGRLLRLYYRTERPLPADVKQVCRLARALTKQERDAVQQVLDEFFELRADGWHQQRCDDEIERYQAGEPEREIKRANEDNRLKRHREERSRLFKIITDAGQHAAWNIKMEELRELAERCSSRHTDTQPATAPATPATATQTPDTNPQTPDTKEIKKTPDPLPGFVEFWSTWPKSTRKGGKAECEKLWRSQKLESVKTEILAHVRTMASSPDWTKDSGAFIPAPVVYLRGKRWDGAEDGGGTDGVPGLFGGV